MAWLTGVEIELDPGNEEEFSRTYDRIKGLAFYLNDNQCHLVIELYENEMRRRWEESGTYIRTDPLRPHSEMDESYFLSP